MNAYEQKQAARKERYERAAQRLEATGNAMLKGAHAERENIPMGQPILIGHHSETRHRNHLDRLHNREQRGFEALDKAKHYRCKAASIENSTAVSSDDPTAVQKLREKLADLEEQRSAIKRYNGIAKKKGYDRMPSYKLTNLGANIRRIKQRIGTLEKVASLDDKTEMVGEVRIERNVDENRVQMFFPGRPSPEARRELKYNGFRWSPSRGCWQRNISSHAENLARTLAEKFS